MRAAGQGCCASPSGLGVLRTPCRRSPTSMLPSAALASHRRVASLRRALRICARLFGVSSMQAAGCGSAAFSSTSSLHAVLHLQSGVPAHYAHAPEHVYASLARTRASPLARPSPLCHAQLSLTSDLTPCSPLTRTFPLLCAVWRFSWVGGWNREFGGPTPRSPSSVKYGPYSGSDTQGRKPRFCG